MVWGGCESIVCGLFGIWRRRSIRGGGGLGGEEEGELLGGFEGEVVDAEGDDAAFGEMVGWEEPWFFANYARL